MRLFYIDKPECRHITEIMPGIKATYQMEAEFEPYLVVDFLPNKNNEPEGIILEAGNEVIRRNYSFDKPEDIDDLRNLIWKYLRKYHDEPSKNPWDPKLSMMPPKDIAIDGCIKDFREAPTNVVIQGWQAKKRSMREDVCCKIVKEMVVKAFKDQEIKHWVYRVNTNNQLDRESCKKTRFEECGNNYPPNSELFNRCVKEVEWLCNNGYPVNRLTKQLDDYMVKLRKDIHKRLMDNDLKVDKKLFDEIITAGLFDEVGNRMGNASTNMMELDDNVDRVMWEKGYYTQLIEGFRKENEQIWDKKPKVYLWMVLIVIFVAIIYFRKYW